MGNSPFHDYVKVLNVLALTPKKNFSIKEIIAHIAESGRVIDYRRAKQILLAFIESGNVGTKKIPFGAKRKPTNHFYFIKGQLL